MKVLVVAEYQTPDQWSPYIEKSLAAGDDVHVYAAGQYVDDWKKHSVFDRLVSFQSFTPLELASIASAPSDSVYGAVVTLCAEVNVEVQPGSLSNMFQRIANELDVIIFTCR